MRSPEGRVVQEVSTQSHLSAGAYTLKETWSTAGLRRLGDLVSQDGPDGTS